MTSKFGPERVNELLAQQEENARQAELRKKQEELKKKQEAEQREAEEKKARAAAYEEYRKARAEKDNKRGAVLQAYLSNVVEWVIEDLEQDILSKRVTPQTSQYGMQVTFVLKDSWVGLSSNNYDYLVQMLTAKLKEEWDSVTSTTATELTLADSNSQEYRVGLQFTLVKQNKFPCS